MTPDASSPPHAVGDTVIIPGMQNLGLQRIIAVEWKTPPGQSEPCWMCKCTDIGTWIDPGVVYKRTLSGEIGGTWEGPCAYLLWPAGSA